MKQAVSETPFDNGYDITTYCVDDYAKTDDGTYPTYYPYSDPIDSPADCESGKYYYTNSMNKQPGVTENAWGQRDALIGGLDIVKTDEFTYAVKFFVANYYKEYSIGLATKPIPHRGHMDEWQWDTMFRAMHFVAGYQIEDTCSGTMQGQDVGHGAVYETLSIVDPGKRSSETCVLSSADVADGIEVSYEILWTYEGIEFTQAFLDTVVKTNVYDPMRNYGYLGAGQTVYLEGQGMHPASYVVELEADKGYEISFQTGRVYDQYEPGYVSTYEKFVFDMSDSMKMFSQNSFPTKELIEFKYTFDNKFMVIDLPFQPQVEINVDFPGFTDDSIYGVWRKVSEDRPSFTSTYMLEITTPLYYDIDTQTIGTIYTDYRMPGFMIPLTSQDEWGTISTTFTTKSASDGESLKFEVSMPIGTSNAYAGPNGHQFILM